MLTDALIPILSRARPILRSKNTPGAVHKRRCHFFVTFDLGPPSLFFNICHHFFQFLTHSTKNGILFLKLFWPTMRKKCYSDPKNFQNSRICKNLVTLDYFFFWTLEDQKKNFEKNAFWRFLRSNTLKNNHNLNWKKIIRI